MTYEYLCTACQHEWEAEQSISDKPLSSCPRCKKRTAKRQVSGGAGFILKGGGWYADGYGSSSKAPSAESEPGRESKTKSESSKSKDKDTKAPKKEAKHKQVTA